MSTFETTTTVSAPETTPATINRGEQAKELLYRISCIVRRKAYEPKEKREENAAKAKADLELRQQVWKTLSEPVKIGMQRWWACDRTAVVYKGHQEFADRWASRMNAIAILGSLISGSSLLLVAASTAFFGGFQMDAAAIGAVFSLISTAAAVVEGQLKERARNHGEVQRKARTACGENVGAVFNFLASLEEGKVSLKKHEDVQAFLKQIDTCTPPVPLPQYMEEALPEGFAYLIVDGAFKVTRSGYKQRLAKQVNYHRKTYQPRLEVQVEALERKRHRGQLLLKILPLMGPLGLFLGYVTSRTPRDKEIDAIKDLLAQSRNTAEALEMVTGGADTAPTLSGLVSEGESAISNDVRVWQTKAREAAELSRQVEQATAPTH